MSGGGTYEFRCSLTVDTDFDNPKRFLPIFSNNINPRRLSFLINYVAKTKFESFRNDMSSYKETIKIAGKYNFSGFSRSSNPRGTERCEEKVMIREKAL